MEPLEIIISAVDETEEAFAAVTEQMDQLTGTIETNLSAQDASFQLAAQVAQESDQEIIDAMLLLGTNAQEAASIIEEANSAIATSSETTAAEVETSSAASSGSLAALGGIGLIAFNSITDAIGKSITNAETWNQSSAVIANNLKNMGSSIPLSDLQAYALQIQQNTLFTQNDAIQAEAQLSGYKNLIPQYQTLLPLAADLATKMQAAGLSGATMQNAMKLISDAMADPVAGIGRLINQAGTALPASMVVMLQNMAKSNDTASAGKQIYDDLNQSIGGSADAAAAAAGGPLVQLSNQLTALGQDMVQGGLLTDLDSLAKAIIPIIEAVQQWTEAHPKLTEAILAAMVVFTALIAVFGLVGLAVALLGGAFVGLGVLIAAAVAIIVGIIVANWDDIEQKTKTLFTVIVSIAKDGLDLLETGWHDGLEILNTIATDIWNAIGATFKTGIDYVITAINGFINAIDAIHISLPSISIPGTKLSTPAVNLGFTIPDIPMLAEGGFVDSPTLAIIGESGPEAVVPLSSNGGFGQGQQIVINIQGGNYLDKQGADQIAQSLATKIQRQLKLTSFR